MALAPSADKLETTNNNERPSINRLRATGAHLESTEPTTDSIALMEMGAARAAAGVLVCNIGRSHRSQRKVRGGVADAAEGVRREDAERAARCAAAAEAAERTGLRGVLLHVGRLLLAPVHVQALLHCLALLELVEPRLYLVHGEQ